MDNRKIKCENCDFYDPWGDYQGFCLRHPPKEEIQERQITRKIDGEVMLATSELYVIVQRYHRCGEFKPRGYLATVFKDELRQMSFEPEKKRKTRRNNDRV